MLSFGVMRELLRAVREHALLGAAVAERIQLGFPTGSLNGWQYAVALFVGLVVVGAYGPGDQRRDPRRLFAACALATALPLWATLWTSRWREAVRYWRCRAPQRSRGCIRPRCGVAGSRWCS